MRFDHAIFAAGLFAGITATVGIAMLVDFQSMRSAICLAEESSTVCVRNWFHVLAVLAGGAAAFIIVWQIRSSERHHREVVALQTHEMRAKFSRILRLYIEPIELGAHRAISLAQTSPSDFRPNVRQLFDPFTGVIEKLDKAMEAVEPYDDGRLAVARKAAKQQFYIFDRSLRPHGSDADKDAQGYRYATAAMMENAKLAGEKLVDFTAAYRLLTDNGSGRHLPEITSRMSILSVLLTKRS